MQRTASTSIAEAEFIELVRSDKADKHLHAVLTRACIEQNKSKRVHKESIADVLMAIVNRLINCTYYAVIQCSTTKLDNEQTSDVASCL